MTMEHEIVNKETPEMKQLISDINRLLQENYRSMNSKSYGHR